MASILASDHQNCQSVTAWVVPPPRIRVANEGLGWDPLLKM